MSADDDPMTAEFDVVPGWTVEAVAELGPGYAVPAACRGSGGPAALRWLAGHLQLGDGVTLLDCGAGMGGPGALVAGETGARVVLADPMRGACRAAAALFGLPTVVASGESLPFAPGSFDAAWSLGVLCTSADQPGLLAELARVVRPGGALGLLVYTRRARTLSEHPQGNDFPTEDELTALLADAGLHVLARADLADVDEAPADWEQRAEDVAAVVERDHRGDPEWAEADTQSRVMARLLASSQLGGTLAVATAGIADR